MARIKIGDIFEINTPKGKAYLHYVYKDKVTGELIRVLQGLYGERPVNIPELATSNERYIVSFPIAAATKQGIVEVVGHYSMVGFEKPKLMRTEHNVRGKFLGWHLVDTETWQRKLVSTLSPEQKKLSPWGVWNDTLLIENLMNNWSLENWG